MAAAGLARALFTNLYWSGFTCLSATRRFQKATPRTPSKRTLWEIWLYNHNDYPTSLISLIFDKRALMIFWAVLSTSTQPSSPGPWKNHACLGCFSISLHWEEILEIHLIDFWQRVSWKGWCFWSIVKATTSWSQLPVKNICFHSRPNKSCGVLRNSQFFFFKLTKIETQSWTWSLAWQPCCM